MKRENWMWIAPRFWNIEKFTMIEITDRGPDYTERYVIRGWIDQSEWCLGLFTDKEDAEEELDRLMGFED